MNSQIKFILKKIRTALSSDLNKRIFNHSFWIICGNILSKGILLLATILMTRYLGKVEYGQFGIIKSTILMFAMFAGLELGMTATKYISQYRYTNAKKVERIVGLSNIFAIIVSIIISIFVFAFADYVAIKIHAPNLVKEVQISSLILFFSSLNGIQNGILAGLEKFKEISINTAIAGVFSSVAMIFAARYLDLQAVVIAFGLNYVLIFILNFVSLKSSFYNQFSINIFRRDNFKEFEILWKFSLPAILAGVLVGPVTWFCNYLLINEIQGYEKLASFDIAMQWRNTVLFIPTALSQIALPLLSANVHNKGSYVNILNKNLRLNFYLCFGIALLFIIFSPLIIHLYTENYTDALIPLIIMFLTTGFIAINNVIGQAIASQGKMWLGLFVNFIWAFALIISCLVFVTYYKLGAIGLALAYFISYAIHTLIQFLYIRNRLK